MRYSSSRWPLPWRRADAVGAGAEFLFNVINLEGTISSFWQSVVRGTFLLGVLLVQARVMTAAREQRG